MFRRDSYNREMIKDRDAEQREWFLCGEADLERNGNSAGNGGRPVLWRVVLADICR
jgi:hypothetical protein